jgi:hypothetical protein
MSKSSQSVPLSEFVIQHFVSDDNGVFNNAKHIEPELSFPRIDFEEATK